MASTAYLERVVPSYNEENQDLYPVPATGSNFEKPFLTPQRHRDFSVFLGGTSVLSLVGLLALVKR